MLAENPIAKFEFEALQRTLGAKRPGYWLRLVFYFGILLVAAIPLFVYIDETLFSILVLMLVIIFLAQLILTLNTLAQAVEQTLHQRQNGMWDVLILTGMSACQVIMGKSNAIVQTLWAEWIILALARFGAAYGLAQYFMAGSYFGCLNRFPNTFCYESWSGAARFPGIIEVVLAFLVIIVISRLELRLVVLIGVSASLFSSRNRISVWVAAVLVWFGITFGAFAGMFLLDHVQAWLNQSANCYQMSDCEILALVWRPGDDNRSREVESLRRFLREVGWGVIFTQSGLSTIGDAGTLFAAQIMRPEYFFRWIYLLRSFIGFCLAVSFYQALNRLFFKTSEYLAIKQGALPEARKRIKINKRYWLKRITGFA